MSGERTKRDGGRRIALTGASGMIGRAVAAALAARGDRVLRLVRREPAGEGEVRWDPDAGTIDAQPLEGLDAVVHLAGENIGGGRWTERRKGRIRDSRVRGTRLLAETLAARTERPAVLLSGSAIGYYGDRGDEPLDEASARGSGFLADVCEAWEAATAPAAAAGVRVVHLRTGIVLAADEGAFPRIARPIRLGMGGPIGGGRQWMSWIVLADVVGAVLHLLEHPEVRGPVNLVAPGAVTNAEFARVVGRVLHRPSFFPLPGFFLRALIGEMAGPLMLEGARALPARLLESGFEFRYYELEAAVRALQGRPANPAA